MTGATPSILLSTLTAHQEALARQLRTLPRRFCRSAAAGARTESTGSDELRVFTPDGQQLAWTSKCSANGRPMAADLPGPLEPCDGPDTPAAGRKPADRQIPKGVELNGVAKGDPTELAGLDAGDFIVELVSALAPTA